MTFGESVNTCLRQKYATFSGRASRSEYWWFVLFPFLINIVFVGLILLLGGLDFVANPGNGPGPVLVILGVLYVIVMLALVLPSLAAMIRRMHDRNLSGWWYVGIVVVGIIPVVGAIVSGIGSIVLLVMLCLKGTEGDNKFGQDPLLSEHSADVFS